MPEVRNPDVWKQNRQAQDRPVNELPRLRKRTHHIQEQNSPNLIGLVHGNMFVRVVEQDYLTFLPVVLFPTVDQRALFVAGNDHPQVHTQNAGPRTFMWHEHFMGAKHRYVG